MLASVSKGRPVRRPFGRVDGEPMRAPTRPGPYAGSQCTGDPPEAAAMPGVEVVEAFRRGDDEAVRLVYREYGRLVFTVALRVLGQRQLAEEATQQAFLQAWRAASTFDTNRPLGPWLATITRRVAIDIHRREARRATTDIDAVPPGHGSLVTLPPSVDAVHDAWAVRDAVSELPPDEHEVVRLQHLEGLSHAEIAEQLGVPVGTVKSRSFRAHRRLAARLGHLRGDSP